MAGQAYFITNDDAQLFWRFLGDFLEPLGYDRPRIKLPFYPILLLAIIFEYLVRMLDRWLLCQIRTSKNLDGQAQPDLCWKY